MVGGGLYSTLGNCMFSCFHIMVHTRIQISAGDGVVVGRIGLSEIVRLGIGTGITRKAIKKKKSHKLEFLCSCEQTIRYEDCGTNKENNH